MTNFRSRRTCVFLLVFLLAVGVVGAFAQHAAKGNGQVNGAASDQQVEKFRAPTAEELQVLTSGLANNDSTEGLVEKTTAAGAIVVDLEGRFENFSLARIDSEGKLVLGCATTAKEARDFFTAAPKKPAPKPTVKPASDPGTWEVK